MSDEPTAPVRLVLDPEERRVLGTLIEKGLTNPQYYPLTLNLLTAGCNQKNNREPLTDYTDDDVEDTCKRLQERGLVAHLFPSTGRVGRWRQELARVLGIGAVELAILGELLLRGPQTEGELRQRASRMRDIPSLEELETLLAKMRSGPAPLVVRLTPEGIQRGVRVTHGCYSDAELAMVLAAERAGGHMSPTGQSGPTGQAAAPPRREGGAVRDDLAAKVAALEQRIAALERRLDST